MKCINHSSGGRKSAPIILRLLPREQPSWVHLLLVSIIIHSFFFLFLFYLPWQFQLFSFNLIFVFSLSTPLQLPTSMQMGRRLMAEECWWTWNEDAQSKDGIPAGQVSCFSVLGLQISLPKKNIFSPFFFYQSKH